MPRNLLNCLDDLDELNTHLASDPHLAANMAEMGFIKRVPFQLDHNGATVAKWDWTPYGRREMLERIAAGAQFAVEHKQESRQ